MVGEYRDLQFVVERAGPFVKLFSPENIKATVTAKWTAHDSLGGLERAEPTGIALAPLSFSLLLRSDAGISAREKIDLLNGYVLDRKAGVFALGGYALLFGVYFVVTSVSEAYGTILREGQIFSAKVDVQLKQYF